MSASTTPEPVFAQDVPEADYAPGSWLAIAGTRTWILIDIPTQSPLVSQLWSLVRVQAELDDILEAILLQGLRTVPAFALVDLSPAARIIVRGTAGALVSSQGAAVTELRGIGVMTWIESPLDQDMWAVELVCSQDVDGATRLPMTTGVMGAASVLVKLRQDSPSTDPAPRPVPKDAKVIPSPDLSGMPKGEDSAPKTISDEDPAPPQEAAAGPTEPTGLSGELSGELNASEDGPAEAVPSFDHLFGATQMPPHDSEPVAGSETHASAGGVQLDGSSIPRGDETLLPTDTSYPRPSGALQTHLGPIGAGPTGAGPTGAGPGLRAGPAGAGGLIDAVPWAAPAGPLPAAPPAPAHTPPGVPPVPAHTPRAAHAVPVSSASAAQASPPVSLPDPPTDIPTAAQDVIPAVATTSRAQLLAAEAAHTAIAGPTVLAAMCSNGHVSPAYAGACRVCHTPIPAQQPFETARPVLGALRLSTGDLVRLDRGVLLGRAPDAPMTNNPDRPHVVALASPENDISRNHLEVRLEGWLVMAVDLGSTNGTVVTLPGEEPQRLRANDPLPIEPGSVVTLADEVSFRFEVLVD